MMRPYVLIGIVVVVIAFIPLFVLVIHSIRRMLDKQKEEDNNRS